jgi:probable H4MPT-linked C1 transfer pathway protein
MRAPEVAMLGWDIGGAHVKVAAVDAAGRPLAAHQVACALWRGLDQLEHALDRALAQLPAGAAGARQAATMTGELADLFADRGDGVRHIVGVLRRRIGGARLQVFAGERGFLNPQKAMACATEVASANWLATAQLLACTMGEALLADIGSTTTDLVAVRGGRVDALGRNDFQRLVSGELVYTGIVRTPLMAVAEAIEFESLQVPLMAEHFATMADVYRLTGELDERCDLHPAADGREKTAQASARRLARMIGRDAHEFPMARWQALAASFRGAQRERILHAAQRVLSRSALAPSAPWVAAGSGAFLVPELARAQDRPVLEFAQLLESHMDDPAALSVCAAATAVAILALRPAA